MPFVIEADPTQPDFEVKDLRPPGHLSDQRLSLRKQLLSGIDHLERERNQSQGKAMSTYYEKASSLVTSEDARKAFNIHAEPDAVRDAYGRTQLGQCALLGAQTGRRRLPFCGRRCPWLGRPLQLFSQSQNRPDSVR